MPAYIKIVDGKGKTHIAGPYESEYSSRCSSKIESLESEGLFCEVFTHKSRDLARVTRSYKEGKIGEGGVDFDEAVSRVGHKL